MSQLTIFRHCATSKTAIQPVSKSTAPEEIKNYLAERGIGFERWPAKVDLGKNASSAEILAAYSQEIAATQTKGDYPVVDAIRVTPNHPDRIGLRQKFLAEHIHAENEVRFFVEGRGLFCLHINDEVLQVLCEQNDWISVPSGTKHWFDMGENPNFSAIRFFNNPNGWVAEFTGDQIATGYPLLEVDN